MKPKKMKGKLVLKKESISNLTTLTGNEKEAAKGGAEQTLSCVITCPIQSCYFQCPTEGGDTCHITCADCQSFPLTCACSIAC